MRAVNETIQRNSNGAAVCFLNLPLPPSAETDPDKAEQYLGQLRLLTDSLPPTMLVHGLGSVISTALWLVQEKISKVSISIENVFVNSAKIFKNLFPHFTTFFVKMILFFSLPKLVLAILARFYDIVAHFSFKFSPSKFKVIFRISITTHLPYSFILPQTAFLYKIVHVKHFWMTF